MVRVIGGTSGIVYVDRWDNVNGMRDNLQTLTLTPSEADELIRLLDTERKERIKYGCER